MIRPDPASARILLVEDFASLRRAWEQTLLIAGYERAESVGTVRDAFARLEEERVDLVIMDVSLSGDADYENGCDAGVAIVRRWPATRIVFVSGFGKDVFLLGLCPPGAPLIEKPIGPQAFLARIAEVMMRPPWKPPPIAEPTS